MEKNVLYIVGGCWNGDILDAFAFSTHAEACENLKARYDDNIAYGGYDKDETSINDWGFTIAFRSGWMEMSIQEILAPETVGITVPLPDGRALHACDKEDPEYPGIKILVLNENQEPDDAMGAAWMEFNCARGDYSDNQRLRTLAWSAIQDEPVLNLSYDAGEIEKD